MSYLMLFNVSALKKNIHTKTDHESSSYLQSHHLITDQSSKTTYSDSTTAKNDLHKLDIS